MAAAPQSATSLLEIAGLVKRFGAFTALDGVDVSMRTGERLVVCGPSGSGKSTLIRCVNRLERPDAGTIRLEGQPIGDGAAALNALRRRVGMVFQQFNLEPGVA